MSDESLVSFVVSMLMIFSAIVSAGITKNITINKIEEKCTTETIVKLNESYYQCELIATESELIKMGLNR